MPVSGGRVGKASASASADNTNAKPSNRGRTDLAYTQKVKRINGCKIIRFPRRIKLDEDNTPEFTARQVVLMRRFLEMNNVDLGQILTTLATDKEQSMELSIARAYNATISDQQRKIISQYKRTPRFTFRDIYHWCEVDCKLRVHEWDDSLGLVSGCVSHDLVKYDSDEDFEFYHFRLLAEARSELDSDVSFVVPSREYLIKHAQDVADGVYDKMGQITETLDEFMVSSIPKPELYEEKFLALDIQYKILHCLLTEDNRIKQDIKAKRQHWERLEACFMKVFEQFDKDDLHRLATDDDGIWCDMFDFVCEFADKEGILPKLSEARKNIAEAFLTRQQDLAKWVKRLKGTS